MKGFYFITDSKLTKKDVIEDVKSALKAGCKVIQYREKEKSDKEMVKEALAIKALCRDYEALFIVNDRVDIALEVDADGIHLGQSDAPYALARGVLGGKKIIGVTVHNVKEAIDAEKNGADYIGVSPIFETSTKKDAGPAAGISLIKEIKECVDIPFVAIGGINHSNVRSVLEAGAKSVVMISAVVSSEDVEGEVRKAISVINEY